ADCIIFDNELSPVQQRNWEKLSKVCVIDRQEVIIDIFARRAQTKEAKLQVELARAEFCLPRLKRAWTHLGRQGGSGGIGDRGEGEMQIEVDRRILRRNVDHLKAELAQVRKHRATQRKHRERVPLPLASIVGYTNAGKSSLLRLLTGADVLVADKLFATLDTTTRRLQLENGQTLLLTDTVGFIRHLPHRLVEAFKSTLEEAVLADFLVHVLDVNHPNVDIFHQTTLDVLRELGADEKRMLTVFNKMDLVQDPARIADLQARYPQAIFVSVKTGAGRDQLLARMAGMLGAETRQMTLWVPHQRADVIASLHSLGRVLSCTYEDDHVHVVAFVPKRVERQFEPFTQAPADLSS
ncbi:MAG: GTPase HflX, partial [Verrucomicrobia bacterium]|nr:GTPase HflX [Verrucomicrobiota bacterium]